MKQKLISVVVPVFNEVQSITALYAAVDEAFRGVNDDYELVLVDDGSTDGSAAMLDDFADNHSHLQVIHLSRNFGKEIALTAGLRHAKGDAAIMLDADLQHPPRYIPDFLAKWHAGADVVVGVRSESGKDSVFAEFASNIYYKIMKRISDVPVIPHATDFRLIDRQVIEEFNRMGEHTRMVRGLIDWLGFDRDYVMFPAAKRLTGEVSYSTSKLIKLAVASFVSMSLVPLKLSMWIGAIIVLLSGPLGLAMLGNINLFENSWRISGAAALSVLILFLIGITLLNIGLLGLYIANIHHDVANRPLYIVRKIRRREEKSKIA